MLQAVVRHPLEFLFDHQAALQARLCVVMPVGQVLVWQRRAWMQPSANMKPRALLTKSAPQASAQAARAEVTSCPAAMTLTLLDTGLDQGIDHARQGLLDRQRHVIGQRLRRGTGTTFAAVDCDEIRRVADAAPRNGLGQQVHELPAADGGLDPHRLARHFAHAQHHVEQLVHVGDLGMAIRRERIQPLGDAADARDLGVTLPPGSTPPLPGLAPCESLISKARTDSWAASSRSFASDRRPSASRTPYFAVPICMITSQPPSR
jgi:hypothetical protein